MALIYRNKTFITCVCMYHCRSINVLSFHIIMMVEENNTHVNVRRVVCAYTNVHIL